MIYAGGLKFLLLSAILYAPGTLLFFLAKRERKEAVFKTVEAAMFGGARDRRIRRRLCAGSRSNLDLKCCCCHALAIWRLA
jgi:hypothetical protein